MVPVIRPLRLLLIIRRGLLMWPLAETVNNLQINTFIVNKENRFLPYLPDKYNWIHGTA